MRLTKKIIALVLAIMSLMSVSILAEEAENVELVKQDPLQDAAFSMLEAGNPFLEAYNEITGAGIEPHFAYGLPYFFGGTYDYMVKGEQHLFARAPEYSKRSCWEQTKFYDKNKVYLYGLDCSGYTRWIYNEVGWPRHDTLSAMINEYGKYGKKYHVYCVMGVNELDDAMGVRTFYNTQIIFGNDGTILGRHRKTKPTYVERVYWGDGDGSDLNVYKTEIGRLGSLICAEHHTISVSRAQMMMGEEIHVANYPGFWTNTGSKTALDPNTTELGEGCDGIHAIKEYAFQANCFVVSVHGLLREQDFEPEYKNLIDSKDMNFTWAIGGSCIVNPFGEFIVKPCVGEATILYADCYAKDFQARSCFYDFMGHYSRPDIAHVEVNHTHPRNLYVNGEETMYAPDYSKLQEISEKYEVALAKLEAMANRIETREKNLK